MPLDLNVVLEKAKKFSLYSSSKGTIVLTWDIDVYAEYGLVFLERVNTPKGPAHFVGVYEGHPWFYLENPAGISHWEGIKNIFLPRTGFTRCEQDEGVASPLNQVIFKSFSVYPENVCAFLKEKTNEIIKADLIELAEIFNNFNFDATKLSTCEIEKKLARCLYQFPNETAHILIESLNIFDVLPTIESFTEDLNGTAETSTTIQKLSDEIKLEEKKLAVLNQQKEKSSSNVIKSIFDKPLEILKSSIAKKKQMVEDLKKLQEEVKSFDLLEKYSKLIEILLDTLLNIYPDRSSPERCKVYNQILSKVGEFIFHHGQHIFGAKEAIQTALVFFVVAGIDDSETQKKSCYINLLKENTGLFPLDFDLDTFCQAQPEKFLLLAKDLIDIKGKLHAMLFKKPPLRINAVLWYVQITLLASKAQTKLGQLEDAAANYKECQDRVIEYINANVIEAVNFANRYFKDDPDIVAYVLNYYVRQQKIGAVEDLVKLAEENNDVARKLLEENPLVQQNPSMALRVAKMYEKLGNGKAILWFTLAAKLGDTEASYFIYLEGRKKGHTDDQALLKAVDGGHQEARKELEMWADNSNLAFYPFHLGRILFIEKNYKEAEKYLKQIPESDNLYLDAQFYLAQIILENPVKSHDDPDPYRTLKKIGVSTRGDLAELVITLLKSLPESQRAKKTLAYILFFGKKDFAQAGKLVESFYFERRLDEDDLYNLTLMWNELIQYNKIFFSQKLIIDFYVKYLNKQPVSNPESVYLYFFMRPNLQHLIFTSNELMKCFVKYHEKPDDFLMLLPLIWDKLKRRERVLAIVEMIKNYSDPKLILSWVKVNHENRNSILNDILSNNDALKKLQGNLHWENFLNNDVSDYVKSKLTADSFVDSLTFTFLGNGKKSNISLIQKAEQGFLAIKTEVTNTLSLVIAKLEKKDPTGALLAQLKDFNNELQKITDVGPLEEMIETLIKIDEESFAVLNRYISENTSIPTFSG